MRNEIKITSDEWSEYRALKKQANEVSSTGLVSALEKVKHTALTCTNAIDGLGRIVRICIDAGVTKCIDELEADNTPVDRSRDPI